MQDTSSGAVACGRRRLYHPENPLILKILIQTFVLDNVPVNTYSGIQGSLSRKSCTND